MTSKARNIADLGSNDVIETTATGVDVTGTVQADGLTVDGQGTFTTSDNSAQVTLISTDTDALVGPKLNLWRNSGVGSNGDLIGEITFTGEDTVASTNTFATISAIAEQASNGSEDGSLHIKTLLNGTLANRLSIGSASSGGDVYFYEDTGTTAKMVWDASAESLSIGNAAGFGALRVGHVGDKVEALVIGDNTTTSSDTGIYLRSDTLGVISVGSTASLSFKTGGGSGTERARIDSSGNLLVGKSSVNTQTVGVELRETGKGMFTASSTDPVFINRLSTDGDMLKFAKDGAIVGSIQSRAGLVTTLILDPRSTGAGITGGGTYIYPTNNTGSLTDGVCSLGIGANRFKDLYLSGAAYLQNSTGGSGGLRLKNPSNNTNAKIATFTGWNNTETGNISTYVNVTSYNTSSDYRLKEDIVELPTATDDVMSLKPCNFAWKGTESRMNGFIAHELAEIVPEAVTGEKDAMRTEEYEVTPAVLDDNGNVVTEAVIGTREVPEYQSIDQSKLVPLLTKALQEAITKIEQLETRIETLENN